MSIKELFPQENILEMIPGDEHKLQISYDISKQTDIMYPAFRAALVAVGEIIESSRKYNEEIKACKNQQESTKLYGYSNNIIAFSGKRGQGKTSAMLTFAGALGRGDKNGELAELKGVDATRFYILDPIDPSMLEGSSTLDVVLSRLFQAAESEWKNPVSQFCHGVPSEKDKREIIQLFQQCLTGVHALRKDGDRDADFEALANLSDGLQLKTKLNELVHMFLSLIGFNAEKDFLIIMLDDTDLQMENAFDVLDEICKYLTLPNVIILMATDLEQLQALVEHHYLVLLEESINQNLLETEYVHKLAANYLNKLIPAAHTIHLPSPDIVLQSGDVIYIGVANTTGSFEKKIEINEYFLTEIYSKTGIPFAKPEDPLHTILPTTLRGIRHLFRLLRDMEDLGAHPALPQYISPEVRGRNRKEFEKEAAERRDAYLSWLEKRERNLNLFEGYLLNEWEEGKLLKDDISLIKKISDAQNAHIVEQTVYFIFKWQSNDKRDNIFGLLEPTRPEKKNIKYIELIRKIQDIEEKCFEPSEALFASAIRILLTIRLYKIALKCQKDSLKNWDVSQVFSFNYDSLYTLFTGGIFADLRPKKPSILPFSGVNSSEILFGIPQSSSAAPQVSTVSQNPADTHDLTASQNSAASASLVSDPLAFFENILVYDPTREDRSDAEAINTLKEYAIYVCCNWEVQEKIREYIDVNIKSANIPNYNDTASDAKHGDYLRKINELFAELQAMLIKNYGFLSPVGLPFMYQGSLLNILPEGTKAILKPIFPEYQEGNQEELKKLLEIVSQLDAFVKNLDAQLDPLACNILNSFIYNISSVEIQDTGLKRMQSEIIHLLEASIEQEEMTDKLMLLSNLGDLTISLHKITKKDNKNN